ncbi:MAG TPA: IPT/TIG domain-containing protein, partial [Solirubrobacteraceae bacterium]|nr:IPT/TIG domain-containing protein [Solirubrobacteraceae bacterium]
PAGTGAPDTSGTGEANATSLPIRAGDLIGIDQPAGQASKVGFRTVGLDTALLDSWSLLAEGVVAPEPFESFEEVILLNADIVLAPVVSALSPTSGGTAGGASVTITGKYLDGATGVTFGATPASSFGVNSSSQITAIAPAEAAGSVDVHVTGPGGLSETVAADRYTFVGPPSSTSAPAGSNSSGSTPIAGGPPAVPVKLAIGGFSQSASKWRRGGSLPRISVAGGRSPLGTTFSFSLNEAAAASLEFSQLVPGRRAGGRCVAQSRANASKPRCKLARPAGSLPVSGHAGTDRVVFQGHLSRTRSLAPGAYEVVINGRDAQECRRSRGR